VTGWVVALAGDFHFIGPRIAAEIAAELLA
jgi:hypothetical protein